MPDAQGHPADAPPDGAQRRKDLLAGLQVGEGAVHGPLPRKVLRRPLVFDVLLGALFLSLIATALWNARAWRRGLAPGMVRTTVNIYPNWSGTVTGNTPAAAVAGCTLFAGGRAWRFSGAGASAGGPFMGGFQRELVLHAGDLVELEWTDGTSVWRQRLGWVPDPPPDDLMVWVDDTGAGTMGELQGAGASGPTLVQGPGNGAGAVQGAVTGSGAPGPGQGPGLAAPTDPAPVADPGDASCGCPGPD